METPTQSSYHVAFLTTMFDSLDEVRAGAPEALAQHLERSQRLHEAGRLLMAGAFLEPAAGPISTMAVLVSREAAEDFVDGDPFVQMGKVSRWEIREWANMLRPRSGAPG
jgi:uncharacterized protein YciI